MFMSLDDATKHRLIHDKDALASVLASLAAQAAKKKNPSRTGRRVGSVAEKASLLAVLAIVALPCASAACVPLRNITEIVGAISTGTGTSSEQAFIQIPSSDTTCDPKTRKCSINRLLLKLPLRVDAGVVYQAKTATGVYNLHAYVQDVRYNLAQKLIGCAMPTLSTLFANAGCGCDNDPTYSTNWPLLRMRAVDPALCMHDGNGCCFGCGQPLCTHRASTNWRNYFDGVHVNNWVEFGPHYVDNFDVACFGRSQSMGYEIDVVLYDSFGAVQCATLTDTAKSVSLGQADFVIDQSITLPQLPEKTIVKYLPGTKTPAVVLTGPVPDVIGGTKWNNFGAFSCNDWPMAAGVVCDLPIAENVWKYRGIDPDRNPAWAAFSTSMTTEGTACFEYCQHKILGICRDKEAQCNLCTPNANKIVGLWDWTPENSFADLIDHPSKFPSIESTHGLVATNFSGDPRTTQYVARPVARVGDLWLSLASNIEFDYVPASFDTITALWINDASIHYGENIPINLTFCVTSTSPSALTIPLVAQSSVVQIVSPSVTIVGSGCAEIFVDIPLQVTGFKFCIEDTTRCNNTAIVSLHPRDEIVESPNHSATDSTYALADGWAEIESTISNLDPVFWIVAIVAILLLLLSIWYCYRTHKKSKLQKNVNRNLEKHHELLAAGAQ